MKDCFQLKNYQQEAIAFMKQVEREQGNNSGEIYGTLLTLSMGLGKTLIALDLCLRDDSKGNLIICSKTLLNVWKEEIHKFYKRKECSYILYHKEYIDKDVFDKITREEMKGYNLIITTYDTVLIAYKAHKREDNQGIKGKKGYTLFASEPPERKGVTGSKLLLYTAWNRIICDEAHNILNPESEKFKALMSLYSTRKHCLTGTPIRNYSSDLYSLFRFLNYDNVQTPREFNIQRYNQDGLKRYIMVRTYEDVGIILPEKKTMKHILQLEGDEKMVYDDFLGKTRKEIENFNDKKSTFMAVLTMFLRLRQVCIAPYITSKADYYIAGVDQKWYEDIDSTSGIYSLKISKVLQILEEIPPREKVIIFTFFVEAIDLVLRAVKKRLKHIYPKCLAMSGDTTNAGREEILDQFRYTEDYDYLFLTYKVGSEGLNLIQSNHMILIEPWWTPVVENQAVARINRMGQERPMFIHKIIISDTIEERIEDVCSAKNKLMGEFGFNLENVTPSLELIITSIKNRD